MTERRLVTQTSHTIAASYSKKNNDNNNDNNNYLMSPLVVSETVFIFFFFKVNVLLTWPQSLYFHNGPNFE